MINDSSENKNPAKKADLSKFNLHPAYINAGGVVGVALWLFTAFSLLRLDNSSFLNSHIFLTSTLIALPVLMIMIFATMLKRGLQSALQNKLLSHHINLLTAQNPEIEGRFSQASSHMLKQATRMREAGFETVEEIEKANAGMEKRIHIIKRMGEAVRKNCQETIHESRKMMKSGIDEINEGTREASGLFDTMLERITEQGKSISEMNETLADLQNNIEETFSMRSGDIITSIDDQLMQMHNSFDEFRDGIGEHHKVLFESLSDKNAESEAVFRELMERQQTNMKSLTDHFDDGQKMMVTDFETRHDLVYARLQNVLKEVTTSTDQLVKRIETRQIQVRDTIDAQSNQILSTFDRSEKAYHENCNGISQALLELGDRLKGQLDGQLNELEGLILETEKNQTTLNEKIRDKLEESRLSFEDGLMDKNQEIHKQIQSSLSYHSDWLGQIAEWIEKQNNQIHQRASEYENLFENTIGQATKNIKGFGKTLEDQLTGIITSSDTAITRLREASEAFEGTFSRLDKASALGVKRATDLEKSLAKSSELLEKSTGKLVSSGDTLLNDLQEQSSRLEEAVTFMKQEQRLALDSFVDDAQTRILKLREVLKNQGGVLNDQLENNLTEQTKMIEQAVDQNFTQFRRISDYIGENLVKTSTQMVDKLVFQGSEIEKSMTTLLQRLVQSSHGLDDGIGRIHGAIESSDIRISDLKSLAQEQLGYFDNLIHRIEHSSQRVKDNIAADQNEIVRILGETERRAISSNKEIVEGSHLISDKTEKAAQKFENIREQMQDHITLIAQISEQAQKNVMVMDGRVQGQIKQISEALSAQDKHIEDAFSPSVKRIGQISTLITQQADTLREDFGVSLKEIGQVSDSFKQQTQQIGSLFKEAGTHLNQAQTRLMQSTDEMKSVADGLDQSSERINNAISTQANLVEKSAIAFEHRLNGLTDHISSKLNMLQEKGKSFSNDFSETGASFGKQAGELHNILETTLRHLDKNSTLYEEGIKRMAHQLENAKVMIENHSRQMDGNETHIIDLQQKSSDFALGLRRQFDGLTGEFDKTAEKITRNVAHLDTLFADQKKGVGLVGNNLEGIRGELQNQCREISRLSKRALDIFSDLPTTLSHQGQAIIRQVSDVRNEAEKMALQIQNDVERVKVQADSIRGRLSVSGALASELSSSGFMNEAETLIEELHKMSRQVFETVFGPSSDHDRSFSGGKRNVYTRDLIRDTSQDSLEKLGRKIKEDGDLNRSVKGYQQRFEELVEKANMADPDHLLPTAFISSDIGRLYIVLARLSGRSPISFDKPH